MELVTDDEEHRLRSWSEEYKITLVDGRPKNCPTNQEIVWAPPHAGGWNLGLRRNDSHTLNLDFFFSWSNSKGIQARQVQLDVDLVPVDTTFGKRIELERKFSPERSLGGDALIICSFDRAKLIGNPIVAITLSYVGPSFRTPPVRAAHTRTTAVLGASIARSLRGNPGTNTAFYLYSQAHPYASRGAYKIMVVYADAQVLRESGDYFRDMFDPDSPFKQNDPLESHSTNYLYESDSDLEEVGDVIAEDAEPGSVGIAIPEVLGVTRHLAIRDTAHKTWAAMIFYLYTGEINFAPLSSKPRVGVVDPDQLVPEGGLYPDYPSPCSPKSMFRLADKLGLKNLEDISFDALVSDITPQHVVAEYFTWFTSKYDRVRDYELAMIQKNYNKPEVGPVFEKRGRELLNSPYVSELILEAAKKSMSSKAGK